jgi:hypothetical protein
MKRCAIFLGLLTAFSLPAPALALREVIVGNAPIGPELGYSKEVLAAVNVPERVYLSAHAMEGSLTLYFKGGPKALNESIRHFAALPADKREIIILPVPAKPLIDDKKPIAYDWCMYIPTERPVRGKSKLAGPATLTIYIPEHMPPPPADPAAVRKWIADLGSDDFKVRERAAKELTDLGPSIAPLLREARKGRVSAEARDRIERILDGASGVIRADVLKIPDGMPVVSLDDLLARFRKKLADRDPGVRGNAAWYVVVDVGAPAEEVLPDLEKMLKTEKDVNPLAGAAWAAYHLGAGARPLLPLLREAAKTADKNLASICQQAIEQIERAKSEPVAEAEAKKRATIRKEIRELVEGLKGKGEE